MKRVLIFYMLALLFSSCNSGYNGKENVETLIIDGIVSENKFDLSEICSGFNYVQLDPSKNIFYEGFPDVIVRDSLLFMLDNKKGCYAFNINNGKQLLHINNIGMGPQEMASPRAFYPDLSKGRLEIYDARRRKLFFYNMKGDFLKSVPSRGLLFVDFTKRKNGEYLLYTGNHINNINGEMINNSLLVTDSAFTLKRTMFEITPERSRFQTSSQVFTWADEQLLFRNFPDGHLYDLSGNVPEPLLRLDFKEKNIPSSFEKNEKEFKTADWVRFAKEKGYSAGISGYHENTSYKFIRFISFEKWKSYYVIYNTSNASYALCSEENVHNDIDGGITGKIVHLDNDRIIILIEPYMLLEKLQKLDEGSKISKANKDLLTKISRKGRNGNPILMIGELK